MKVAAGKVLVLVVGEIAAVLNIVNNGSTSQLDFDAAMNKSVAENIISDRPITSINQLESISYVGQASMTGLKDYIEVW